MANDIINDVDDADDMDDVDDVDDALCFLADCGDPLSLSAPRFWAVFWLIDNGCSIISLFTYLQYYK
jgi:hypothetical protein